MTQTFDQVLKQALQEMVEAAKQPSEYVVERGSHGEITVYKVKLLP